MGFNIHLGRLAKRLPKPNRSEILTFGVAGVVGFAPVYCMVAPRAAADTFGHHTSRWAPRWEHLTSNYLVPPSQSAVRNHVAPRAERTMVHVDRLASQRAARAAQRVDRQIRAGIARVQK